MEETKKMEKRSTKFNLSWKQNDEVIPKWMAKQDSIGKSILWLIRRQVEKHGYIDVLGLKGEIVVKREIAKCEVCAKQYNEE